jgi:ribosome-associated translation inhibitor RaiA
MQIQINAPHETIPDAFAEHIRTTVEEVLAPFAKQLTRVEIHLRDLNGSKGGVDKRCLIEARPAGLDPLAAEQESETIKDAFRGALSKLQHVLQHRFGKISSKGHGR